jgi:hypothetical protein
MVPKKVTYVKLILKLSSTSILRIELKSEAGSVNLLPLRPGTLCAILSGRLPALEMAVKKGLRGLWRN